MCVCAHERVAKKAFFELAPEYPEDLSLSIFAQRLHRAVPMKTCETRRRMKDIILSGVRLWGGQLGVRLWSMESRHRAMKTMKRWVSIFGSCVGFSLTSHNSHEHTYIEEIVCSSKSIFVCSFLPPCLFLVVIF